MTFGSHLPLFSLLIEINPNSVIFWSHLGMKMNDKNPYYLLYPTEIENSLLSWIRRFITPNS